MKNLKIPTKKPLKSIIFFCLGLVFISFAISLRNCPLTRSLMMGLILAIDYQISLEGGLFGGVLLIVLSAIRDAHQYIVPFLTFFSISVASYVSSVVSKHNDHQSNNITRLTIEFAIFCGVKGIVTILMSTLLGRNVGMNIDVTTIFAELLSGIAFNLLLLKISQKQVKIIH